MQDLICCNSTFRIVVIENCQTDTGHEDEKLQPPIPGFNYEYANTDTRIITLQ